MRLLKFWFWRGLSHGALCLGGRCCVFMRWLDAKSMDYETRSWSYEDDEAEEPE